MWNIWSLSPMTIRLLGSTCWTCFLRFQKFSNVLLWLPHLSTITISLLHLILKLFSGSVMISRTLLLSTTIIGSVIYKNRQICIFTMAHLIAWFYFQELINQPFSRHLPLKPCFVSIVTDTSRVWKLKYLPHLFWKRISHWHVDITTVGTYCLVSTFGFVDEVTEEKPDYWPYYTQDRFGFSIKQITCEVEPQFCGSRVCVPDICTHSTSSNTWWNHCLYPYHWFDTVSPQRAVKSTPFTPNILCYRIITSKELVHNCDVPVAVKQRLQFFLPATCPSCHTLLHYFHIFCTGNFNDDGRDDQLSCPLLQLTQLACWSLKRRLVNSTLNMIKTSSKTSR